MTARPLISAGIAWIACAVGGSAEDAAAPARPTAAVQRLATQLRDRKVSLDRQLNAVRALADLGPAGVAAWHDHVARELERLTRVAESGPRETQVDRDIESLRRKLADLRADADLTHEELEAEGLPALEQLQAACAKRNAALKPWRVKQAAAREQALRLAALIEACRDAARDGQALATVGPFEDGPARAVAARLESETSSAAAVLAENEQIAKALPPEVAAGTRAVDAVRMACGLGPLLIDPKLCTAATGHSADMAAHDFFAHESPLPGKKDPWDRARLADTTASAENIFKGSTSGTDAVKAWFLSPGHHKNLLGDGHRRQGLGCSGDHWTQLFGD